MYNLIWNNKPEKNKRDTLELEYKNGGLKKINISCFFKSIKAC
jgi:hypothetical protein